MYLPFRFNDLICLKFGLRDVKLQTLNILCIGLPLVSIVEEGGSLLPLIHTLWSPLVSRFYDTDKVYNLYKMQITMLLGGFDEIIRSGANNVPI